MRQLMPDRRATAKIKKILDLVYDSGANDCFERFAVPCEDDGQRPGFPASCRFEMAEGSTPACFKE